jgi:hypothetical protein
MKYIYNDDGKKDKYTVYGQCINIKRLVDMLVVLFKDISMSKYT